jgi:very-short-patch-repair endonuclease
MKDRRKELRKSLIPQELKLWLYLKNKNLGVKFRRQQGIGPYIADFYCKEKNLVVELDGSRHKTEKEYDKERDNYMESLGIKVLRFWNNEVDKNIEGVLMKIQNYIHPSVFRQAQDTSPSQGRKNP